MPQQYVGVSLPLRVGRTGMFEQTVSVREQTKTNFRNLILTKKGERLGQPTLGCDLWKIVLFEQMTDEIIEKARLSVIEAVANWLPFLKIEDFSVQLDQNGNTVNISSTYSFRYNPYVRDTVTISFNGTEYNVTRLDKALYDYTDTPQGAIPVSTQSSPYGVTTTTTVGGRRIRGFLSEEEAVAKRLREFEE